MSGQNKQMNGIRHKKGGCNEMAKSDKPFYWYTFEDGYRECTRGYNRNEMQRMIREHGDLVKMEEA